MTSGSIGRTLGYSDVNGRATELVRTSDESGSTLVLALIFLLIMGLTTAGFVFGRGVISLNTANLKTSRSLAYATGSAAQVAIWNSATATPSHPARPVRSSRAGRSTP